MFLAAIAWSFWLVRLFRPTPTPAVIIITIIITAKFCVIHERGPATVPGFFACEVCLEPAFCRRNPDRIY